MLSAEKIESLIINLPDAGGARRFYNEFAEKFPAQTRKLLKNDGLLSDVLTLAAFSPLLATTLLQNPEYVAWLERQRTSAKVRGKDELLESLERFALTNSTLDTNVLLARFRRRELLRIYLQDIRALETVSETTEEISNLADAILEYALRQAAQQLENRFGAPLEADEKGRAKTARFCVVALGKLGSKELNYASDIDLLFLYSNGGATGGQYAPITNREYFVKLAETLTRIVGAQTGEGAAYRVDLRLRPNGSVGALAVSFDEAVRYYKTTARAWERQVLIRSRACAGDATIFQRFFQTIKSSVFLKDETVENALRNVRLSKDKINAEKNSGKTFDVKLGAGGIREIEFIAQALQLAYAGRDEWLAGAPHTLISLSRLADRRLLSETDLTELFDAYAFLRALEHRLQMENGLQTHRIPEQPDRLLLAARRMNFRTAEEFNECLTRHAGNVNRIFERVFSRAAVDKIENAASRSSVENSPDSPISENRIDAERRSQINDSFGKIVASMEKSAVGSGGKNLETLKLLSSVAAPFAERLAAKPDLVKDLPSIESDFARKDYRRIFFGALESATDFATELAILRKTWTPLLFEIVAFDAFEKISLPEIKRAQTALAEASVEAALLITKRELERRTKTKIDRFPFAVLGLGKLGGGAMDYNSDLDLILVFDEVRSPKSKVRSPGKDESETSESEQKHKGLWALDFGLRSFYARAAEIFTTVLSSLTRDGLVYRVDLRLRPDGKNGAAATEKTAFLNYLSERAAVWEWLAYVKLRAVAGDADFARETEERAREIVHRNALAVDAVQLRRETARVRERLEREKSGAGKSGAIDIKFGAGGLLDVYFAVRFLQLRDRLPDEGANRSTVFTLERLFANRSLGEKDFQNFKRGCEFLSELDHNLRLCVGNRSTRLPAGNTALTDTLARRMKLASGSELIENLTAHRLDVRASFENIFRG